MINQHTCGCECNCEYNYRIVQDEDNDLWGFQIGIRMDDDSMEVIVECVIYSDRQLAECAAVAFLEGMTFNKVSLQ